VKLRADLKSGGLSLNIFAAPPQPIPTSNVTPSALPEVWSGQTATAIAISVALSNKTGNNLPWATVREAISGAIRARVIEVALDSGPWPCDFAAAQNAKFRLPTAPLPPGDFKLTPDMLFADAELRPSEIQDLAENIAEIRKAAGETELKFRIRLELGSRGKSAAPEIVGKLNALLGNISKTLVFK
jgi:hypothetical protein